MSTNNDRNKNDSADGERKCQWWRNTDSCLDPFLSSQRDEEWWKNHRDQHTLDLNSIASNQAKNASVMQDVCSTWKQYARRAADEHGVYFGFKLRQVPQDGDMSWFIKSIKDFFLIL